METSLTDRLAALSSLKDIPRPELAWLVKHGHLETFEAGTLIGVKGDQLDDMYIILSGCLIVRIDRGAGPKVVSESRTGTVAGRLPYSRLITIPGDAYVEGKTEALIIHRQHFPSLIKECPLFTAHTVHRMIDRTRQYNTSDLQEEKLISLGKLAAGLAHELNNPASAAIRNARLLVESQTKAESASHLLAAAALNQKQYKYIEEMRDTCLKQCVLSPLSSLQKSDLEDALNGWLVKQESDPALAGPLADTALTPDMLNNLAEAIPSGAVDSVLKWIIASCSARTLAHETEKAAQQIYKLVDAVKKFTYMDNLSEKESVNVESGIRDALRVLESKTKAKQADIRVIIPDHLPNVSANGADLNQVWFNLLDNALDAISDAGTIRIEARAEQNQVSVSIVDNGPGIPPDKISRIFDAFYTTKPPGQGTGLGLDLTRRLLRRFKGDVTVQSQPGNTEFCVRLRGDTSVVQESPG
jgi:signal transduction histidine kinase